MCFVQLYISSDEMFQSINYSQFINGSLWIYKVTSWAPSNRSHLNKKKIRFQVTESICHLQFINFYEEKLSCDKKFFGYLKPSRRLYGQRVWGIQEWCVWKTESKVDKKDKRFAQFCLLGKLNSIRKSVTPSRSWKYSIITFCSPLCKLLIHKFSARNVCEVRLIKTKESGRLWRTRWEK